MIVVAVLSIVGLTGSKILSNINLGLDLQGGFELLYEVSPVNEGEEVTQEVLQSTVNALNRRINVLGVSEPNIQIEGQDRIRVQLAGITDQNQARSILGTEARLSFRDIHDNLLMDGADLVQGGASQQFDQLGNAVVSLTVQDADKFAEVTQSVLDLAPNNLMVIWLDFEEDVDSFEEESQSDAPRYLSAATVNQVFRTTDVQITGNFTVQEAQELAGILNAGALPVELTEIYSTTVEATFGEQALQDTLLASGIALVAIFLFMLVFYRIPGIIAIVTLSSYLYSVLLIVGWMNAVLTLPGIAALVLGVGMAVDTNIIIYERIKDELKIGRSVLSAYRAGSRHSLSTIIDANVTTLIVAIVMYIFGTSSVQGFATMLLVGLAVTTLTCIVGTRVLLDLLVKSRVLDKRPSFFGVKPSAIVSIEESKGSFAPTKFDKIDFVKIGNKLIVVSGILVVLGAIVLGIRGLNLGLDFSSGTRIEVRADRPLTVEEIEESLANMDGVDIQASSITFTGENNQTGVIRTVDSVDSTQITLIQAAMREDFGNEPNISTVSPTVGQELARNAMYAVLIAAAGIVIYISFRFQFYYAVSSIIALLHAAFSVILVFSLLQIEVDITFIAAILTIVGYSINDMIVNFDRVRENYKLKEPKTGEDLKEIVNDSLRQTFVRSVNTVLTVLFAIVSLYIFGSFAIQNFSLALLIGTVVGVYSSQFIAAQIWMKLETRSLHSGKKKPKKKVERRRDEPVV